MKPSPELAEVIADFYLAGEAQLLSGGSTANYRVENVVIQYVTE